MAAKDYKICPALFNAYIAKVSKRTPNMMTDDRRVITEEEILALIDWYANKELPEDYKLLCFDSIEREGKVVKICYTNKLPNEENNVQR